MSLPAKSLGLRFCASRKGGTGGGGWVSTLGPSNMAASGLSCRKPLGSTGWAISLLLYTNGLRKRSSGHVYKACICQWGLCRGDHWPKAVTIASSLDSGCGLSLKCVQVGCNGTCVKLNRDHNAHCPIKTQSHMAQKPHREELKYEKNHYDVTQGSVSATKVRTFSSHNVWILCVLVTSRPVSGSYLLRETLLYPLHRRDRQRTQLRGTLTELSVHDFWVLSSPMSGNGTYPTTQCVCYVTHLHKHSPYTKSAA